MKKTFEPLVTCIIPVYNAEKYLGECVDSLLRQSYKKLEIILVDDHSTDSSWVVCQEYADTHENIIAVQTDKNSGTPLEGRRLGIKYASGEWITFMDNDDYVKKDYIKHLVEGTDNGRYDISVTGHSRLYNDGTVEEFKWPNFSQTTVERLNEFYEHFMTGDYHVAPADTVGQNLVRAGVVKKTDLSGLKNDIYAEDTIMALSFLANSKNGVNFVDYHDFVWRQLVGSGSHGGFYRRADRNAFYDACVSIFSRADIKKVLNSDIGKISVIVPIYNVEKYVSRCIDSILSQTYTNIEVVLVDDKTPDGSGKIADTYAEKDGRVKVIHKKENEGLNMARASGFKLSTGRYVMFVDSDDLIARDCIEFAHRAIVKNKAEFAKFNSLSFSSDDELSSSLASVDELHEERVLAGKKDLFRSRFESQTVGVSRVTVWGGLYPRAAVKKVDWKKANYRQHEDMHWTMQFLENVNKGVFISRVGYFYRTGSSNEAVLSKALAGNTYNEKPIGYLEFADHYLKTLDRYNKKYNLELDKEINRFRTWQWMNRLSRLSKAGLLMAENNSDYLSVAVDSVIDGYKSTKSKVSQQEAKIAALLAEKDDMRLEIEKLRHENDRIKTELKSHSSIKRSAKLLLGNIKRKIRLMIK